MHMSSMCPLGRAGEEIADLDGPLWPYLLNVKGEPRAAPVFALGAEGRPWKRLARGTSPATAWDQRYRPATVHRS